MKFSLRRSAIILFSVSLLTTSTSFAESFDDMQQTRIENGRNSKALSLESFVHAWHILEESIISGFHVLEEYLGSFFHTSQQTAPRFKYDVTLVGFVNFADGIGRHPILFKECLENQATMNFLSTRDIPAEIEDAQLGLPRLDPTNKADIGGVSILTDILADKALAIYKKVPDSVIKIAYTMFESSQIPNNWVTILNKKFDAAVVPDPFLIDVYQKSGVTIPIFVLPLALMLQDFLDLKQAPAHKPFVFGMSGGFWERKNHMKVLEAFAAEFGNNSNFKLRLHGRFGEQAVIDALANTIKACNLTNVELIVKPYSRDEYLEFFKSLDCYVFLSKGEGFSVTPREALACGKPCILTKNTGQITICDSGATRMVTSDILVPAFYDCHYDSNCSAHCGLACFNAPKPKAIGDELENLLWESATIGYQFDCTVSDACDAMRDVYENYGYYLKKAALGRGWVKQYLSTNLGKKYVSLVKPKTAILGKENIIGDTFIMTNSETLHAKYQYLLGNS